MLNTDLQFIQHLVNDTDSHVFITNTKSAYYFGYDDTDPSKPVFSKIELGEKIIGGSGGLSHFLLVTESGRVFGFGNNQLHTNPLGLIDQASDWVSHNEPELVNIDSPVVSVATGHDHSVFLTENRQVYSCGHNQDLNSYSSGKLGRKTKRIDPKPSPFDVKNKKFKKISASLCNTLALTENNKLYVYQNSANTNIPVELLSREGGFLNLKEKLKGSVIDIATGWGHCLVLTDKNEIYAFGKNEFGQLLSNKLTDTPQYHLTQLKNATASKIEAHYKTSLIYDTDNNLHCFGKGFNKSAQSLILANIHGQKIKSTVASTKALYFLTDTNHIYAYDYQNSVDLEIDSNGFIKNMDSLVADFSAQFYKKPNTTRTKDQAQAA